MLVVLLIFFGGMTVFGLYRIDCSLSEIARHLRADREG